MYKIKKDKKTPHVGDEGYIVWIECRSVFIHL